MVYATVIFLPEYLQSVTEVSNHREAMEWFMELPMAWQWAIGFGIIGVAISLFLLLIASWFKH
jgi:hypothetical protein